MNVKTVELTLVKSTKGTHVYGSDLPDAATQSVYIQRSALPEKPPAVIRLTLNKTPFFSIEKQKKSVNSVG